VNPNASEEDIQLALKNPALKRCLNVLKKASKQLLAKVD
jgi:hypothetical protein